MKKILILALGLFISSNAYAITCADNLVPLFKTEQAAKLCKSFGSAFVTSLLPATTATYDLGSSSLKWRDAYFSRNITVGGTLTMSDNIISATADKGIYLGLSSLDASVTTVTSTTPIFNMLSDTTAAPITYIANGANATGFEQFAFKTRAASGSAASTIVASGDDILTLTAYGANGTGYDPAAKIIMESGGTPGAATDMPGQIVFQTTPDGSATLASVLTLAADKSATFTGVIKSTATNVGWQIRSGANTACNTTCTASHGCLFGQDTGSANIAVDCTNATADVCVCSF